MNANECECCLISSPLIGCLLQTAKVFRKNLNSSANPLNHNALSSVKVRSFLPFRVVGKARVRVKGWRYEIPNNVNPGYRGGQWRVFSSGIAASCNSAPAGLRPP